MMVGGVRSSTRMVCMHEAVLPQGSVAVHWRQRKCVLAQLGLTMLSLWVMAISVGVQSSVAVASPRSLGSMSSSHSTVTSVGQVMLGGVSSATVMVWTQLPTFPQLSALDHVLWMV